MSRRTASRGPKAPLTLAGLLRWAEARLQQAGLCFAQGTDNARDEAAWLVLHALGEPVDRAPAALQRPLGQGELKRAVDLVERRVRTRRPAAYLTGRAWFCGLEFEVDDSVLIPRSPIAELIAQRFAPWCDPRRVGTVLDLCTGSGCIAVACALAFAQARVEAADLSRAALAVARRNLARHGLSERVRLSHSDLFAGLAGRRYDLIVSNPPYVPRARLDQLPAELRAEPRMAFDGGEQGLELVARMLLEASHHLNENGTLVVEVGEIEDALERQFPTLSFIWPELRHGGSGVFVLGAEQLRDGLAQRGEQSWTR